jgi:hypothetical protein
MPTIGVPAQHVQHAMQVALGPLETAIHGPDDGRAPKRQREGLAALPVIGRTPTVLRNEIFLDRCDTRGIALWNLPRFQPLADGQDVRSAIP